MIRRAASLLLSLLAMAGPGLAEDVSRGDGAVLRALDKVNGETTDLELLNGAEALYGGLKIHLAECRYPIGNPAGNAYAYLQILDQEGGQQRFQGWMMASAPALNALDHARYDVWVLRCKTPSGE